MDDKEKERQRKELLERYAKEDWQRATNECRLFAIGMVGWKRKSPHEDPSAMVNDAICKLLSGVRTWRRDLSLAKNINRIVRSDYSNYIRREKRNISMDACDPDNAESILSERCPSQTPEEDYSDQKKYAVHRSRIETIEKICVEKDDKKSFDIIGVCKSGGASFEKTAEISDETGIPVKEVNKAKKRIRRISKSQNLGENI